MVTTKDTEIKKTYCGVCGTKLDIWISVLVGNNNEYYCPKCEEKR